jgi:4-hydroxy-2-oxoglutarate aldolase
MTSPFKGVYAALTTPFEGDGVSVSKLRDNIRAFNRFDLAGYVVLGSTAETVYLSDAESERLVAAAVEAAAPGKPVIAGSARESTKLTIEFTNRLASLGVKAALVRTPGYYRSQMTAQALEAHYLAVAEASRLPVLIYNFPQNTGIALESSLVVKLARHPNIAGLKDSSGNLAAVGEVVPHVPSSFSFLMGTGSLVLPALLMGASGAILAVANAAAGPCARLYRLFQDGHHQEARRLQLDLVPLNRAAVSTYGIAGLKYAMDLLGLCGGPVRSPLLPLADKGRAEIEAILQKLGLLAP